MKVRKLAGITLGATFATLVTFGSPSSALAYEPGVVHEGWSVAGLVGFGENEFLFDTGVRFGYTLPGSHVYLGGTILLNVGSTGYYGASVGSTGFTTGFEGGYEFPAGPLTVRPYGGVGFVNETYSAYYGNPNCAPNLLGGNSNCGTVVGTGYGNYTTSSFAIWAGGTAIYDFKGGPWFVAGDIRLLEAPFMLTNQVGFQFMPGGGFEF